MLSVIRDADVVHQLAPFLTWIECGKFRCVCRKNILDQYTASSKIYQIWFVKKTENWINEVICLCLKQHSFFWRTAVNVSNKIIPASMKNASRIEKMRKFVHLRDWLLCPLCNHNPVDTAVFYALGTKMQYSIPYIDFCCLCCKDSIEIDWLDVYMSPYYTTYYDNLKWTRLYPPHFETYD